MCGQVNYSLEKKTLSPLSLSPDIYIHVHVYVYVSVCMYACVHVCAFSPSRIKGEGQEGEVEGSRVRKRKQRRHALASRKRHESPILVHQIQRPTPVRASYQQYHVTLECSNCIINLNRLSHF